MAGRVVSVATIMSAARQAADMVGDDFVTDAEVVQHVNAAWGKLRMIVKDCYSDGGHRYEDNETFVTTSGVAAYPLTPGGEPTVVEDGILGVYTALEGDLVALNPVEFANIDSYVNDDGGWVLGKDIRYRIFADNIEFFPTPQGAHTIRFLYIAGPETLTDSDSVDGVSGWENYVIQSVAAALVKKDRGDYAFHLRERDDAERLIRQDAKRRTLGPKFITRTKIADHRRVWNWYRR